MQLKYKATVKIGTSTAIHSYPAKLHTNFGFLYLLLTRGAQTDEQMEGLDLRVAAVRKHDPARG